jgi:hypothetical protein
LCYTWNRIREERQGQAAIEELADELLDNFDCNP